LAAFATLAWSPAALAEDAPPDPFEDYAAAHPEAAKVEPVTPPEVAKKQQAKPADRNCDDDVVQVPYKKGSWLVGGGLALSYTGSSNELVGGADASNSNLFFRLQAHGAYFLFDRVQLGAGLGLMAKSLGREAGEKATETNFFFEANAHYVLPIVPRFAFTPGVGLGMYFGGSSRTLYVVQPGGAGTPTTEDTSTIGAHASLNALFAYQLSKTWQLRSGLTLSGLIGSESVASANASLGSSALHIGLPLQLNATF
jgi:hypothetical protein